MNRPNELIKGLKEFNETMYGYELSRSECKELTDYISLLEKTVDKAVKTINKGIDGISICPKNRDCLYEDWMVERDCDKCWKEYLFGEEG